MDKNIYSFRAYYKFFLQLYADFVCSEVLWPECHSSDDFLDFCFYCAVFSIPEIKKARELSVKIFLENQLMFYQKFSLQNGVY